MGRRMITTEQRRVLRDADPCQHCGGYHLRACNRVKRLVWKVEGPGAGQLVEVEFFPGWDDSETLWPEEIFSDEEQVSE